MDAPRDVILLSIGDSTAEIEELVRSLGYRVVDRLVQKRRDGDPGTFLGSGKLKELRKTWSETDPDPSVSPGRLLGVVDAALKPPQLFGIEDILRIEVWDRIRVILEIFQQKAQVKEAKLQVQLARLRYELPFVHEALHRSLTGEHPGFMGGGELPMRAYETQLKDQTGRIQKELRGVKKERAQRREGRRRSGFRLVAIAGYTNSGKSSLLNAVCGSQAYVENLYFSTLQTTTRRLRPELLEGRHTNLLFTDTVGFIRDLPPWLVDAFSSTLEEVANSDVVLLVVDASEPVDALREKLTTAWKLLDQLQAPKKRFILLNKADLLSTTARMDIQNTLSLPTYYPTTRFIWISSRDGEGIPDLVRQLIEETVPSHQVRIELDPLDSKHVSFESWLQDHTDKLRDQTRNGRREIVVRCSAEQYVQLRRRGKAAGVTLEELVSTGN